LRSPNRVVDSVATRNWDERGATINIGFDWTVSINQTGAALPEQPQQRPRTRLGIWRPQTTTAPSPSVSAATAPPRMGLAWQLTTGHFDEESHQAKRVAGTVAHAGVDAQTE